MILGLKSLLQSVAESGEGGKQAARDPVGSSMGRNALLEAVLPRGRARHMSASHARWHVGCWPLSRAERSREPGVRDASWVRTGIRIKGYLLVIAETALTSRAKWKVLTGGSYKPLKGGPGWVCVWGGRKR